MFACNMYSAYRQTFLSFVYKMYTKCIQNVCIQNVYHFEKLLYTFCIQNLAGIAFFCIVILDFLPIRFSRLIYLLLSLVLVFMSMIKVLWSGYFLPLSLYSCGSSMNTLDIIDASLLLQRPWSLVDFSLLLHVFTLVCLPTQHLGHFINCRCCISTISLNRKPPLLIILSPFTLISGHCLF